MIAPDPNRPDAIRLGVVERMIDAGAVVFAMGAWLAFSVVPARVVAPVFLHDPNYSHGLLFPVMALVLAWRSRVQLAAAANGVRWPGFCLLAAGAGLAAVGHWVHTVLGVGWRGHVFLQAAGWLVATAGWICVLIGWSRFRILAPRLGFMVFVVPLPDTWLLTLMLALQRAVAVSSASLLQAMGVVVCREGDLLHFASITLGVAGACSGIRSLMAFFATAAVCAVYLDLRAARALLLLALAPVVAVGSNILRVIATSLLAIRWGPVWIEGALHGAMGLTVIVLGGVILFGAAQCLRQASSPPAETPRYKGTGRCRPASLRTAALAGAMIFLAASLGVSQMSRHYEHMAQSMQIQSVERLPLAGFPHQVGSYRVSGEFQLAPFEQDMLRPSDHLIRIYVDGDGTEMRLTVLYWNPQPRIPGALAPPPVPHSPNLCWRYEGWELVFSEMSASCEWMPDAPIEVSLFEKSGRQRLVLFWRSKDEGNPRLFTPTELWNRLETLVRSWREVPEGWVAPLYQVRIDTDVDEQSDKAMSRAIEFARQIVSVLPDYGIGQPSELVRLSRSTYAIAESPQ